MRWNPIHWLAAFLLARSRGNCLPIDDSKPAVVLVHGLYDSGNKMEWLAAQFAQLGYETFCPSITPSDGSRPLGELSAQLDRKIQERFHKSRRLHIIGFSMGGLITRHWLANLVDRSTIVSYSTLAAPHNGTICAWLHGGAGGREMRPQSAFLTSLAASDADFSNLRPLSIYTPLDLIILPASSSRWKAGTNRVIWLPAHPLMVFSPTVSRLLRKQFAEAERSDLAED